MKKNHAQTGGFTLIEIMVSLAIFTVVALIAVGAFLKIIDANKQSQALQTAMNNTSFALESMVREMRVGSNYYCFNADAVGTPVSTFSSLPSPGPSTWCSFPGPAGQNGHNGIAFYSSELAFVSGVSGPTCNLIHAYRFFAETGATSTLEKAEQTACTGQGSNIGASDAPFIPLVSADLSIQQFDVAVSGGNHTSTQPEVFVLIKAFAGPSPSERTYFTVQTTASQRSMTGS